MKKNISEEMLKELTDYFRSQEYSSKSNLIHKTREQISELLADCEFVYVADKGSVIHTKRFCGNAYGDPVHIEQAIKHGYKKLCDKCAAGTYAEWLYKKYNKD